MILCYWNIFWVNKNIMRKIFSITAVFFSFFLFVNPAYTRSSDQAKQNLRILLDRRECPNCDLSGLDLTRLDLSHTNLQGADLSFSLCNLTNFAYADLKGAKLHGTVLVGADMEGVDLRRVDLSATDMESAFLGDALFDDDTAEASNEIVKSVPVVKSSIATGMEKEPVLIRANRYKKMRVVPPLSSGQTLENVSSGPPLFPAKESFPVVTDENGAPPFITAHKKKRRMAAMGYVADKNGRTVIRALHRKKRKGQPDISNSQRDEQLALLQPVSSNWRMVPTTKIFGRSQSVSSSAAKAKQESLLSAKSVQRLASGTVFTGQGGKRRIAGSKGARSVLPESMKNRTKRSHLLRLLKTNECNGCNLAGLDLSGQSFVGANLEQANLTGCKLRGADLRRANLKAARLVKAEMQQVRLDGALLKRANLSYANLTGASMSGINFTDAQLTGVVGLDRN